ncbi:MAG TPA: hypothetical protein VFQ73_03760 [Flavisolibacter sp.]|nr:hypothetical protein [Flavisolibacter sp.]
MSGNFVCRYKTSHPGPCSEKEYAGNAKQSANTGFDPAKATAVCILPFIDQLKALVEKGKSL